MNPLQRIPPEIILGVVRSVTDHFELLALRLTCKALNQYATPMAFRNLTFWLEEKSLERLVKISESPHLARYVQHVSCGMQEFYDISFDTFRHYRWEMPSAYLIWSYNDSVTRMNSASLRQQHVLYDEYRNGFQRQEIAREQDAFLTMASRALRSFPALTSFDLTDDYNPSSGTYGVSMEDYKDSIYRLSQRLELPYLRGTYQLNVLVKTLKNSKSRLHRLSLVCTGNYAGSCTGGSLHEEVLDQRTVREALATLKELSFTASSQEMYHYGVLLEDIVTVTSLLQAAVHLTKLTLKIVENRPVGKPPPYGLLEGLLGAATFNQLEELRVEHVALEESELETILSGVCPRLKSLHLSHIFLLSGTWARSFRAIQQLPLLEIVSLLSFRFNLNDDPDDPIEYIMMFKGERRAQQMALMMDYLFCRRSDDPWIDMVCEELRLRDEELKDDETNPITQI